MCMLCAAIPATAALGAKLNADQIHRLRQDIDSLNPAAQRNEVRTRRLPVPKLTALAVALLLIGSITYHTLTYRP